MKYMIFGDFHGKDLQKLEKALLIENPDSLICLGDFDQVQTIRQFMDIEKEYIKNGKEVIKVPGNHDYALLNNHGIISGALIAHGKNIYQLHDELIKDKEAHNYIINLVNSDFTFRGFLDKKKLNKKYPFVVIHGAYFGDMSSCRSCNEEIKPLWNRLISEQDFHLNFEELKKRGEKIMIRGHDHLPVYAVKDSTGEEIEYASTDDRYELYGEKEHIINSGALLYGHFVTIDTSRDTPALEYKNI